MAMKQLKDVEYKGETLHVFREITPFRRRFRSVPTYRVIVRGKELGVADRRKDVIIFAKREIDKGVLR